ncbi:MAG TPA: helix-hairpin-helix domain-containing protein [Planctomycetota bacterium]|nr:helix-hairpin-helix domain-containing protein [Planctomycetota bacterium]
MMHDTAKSWARSDIWRIPAAEFVVLLLVLFVVCAVAVTPHMQSRGALAEIQIQRSGAAFQPVGIPGWRMDVNSATQAELESLPGIGPKRAAAIISERKRRGAFRDIWELCEVPGLTRGMVKRLEPMIQVQRPAAERPDPLLK